MYNLAYQDINIYNPKKKTREAKRMLKINVNN